MTTARISLTPKKGFRSIGSALQHPNYRRFFSGQFLSVIGNWVQTIALGWLVWRLGLSSPFLLGLLAFCSQGPILFFGLFTGVIVDRCDRRHLLIATQSGQTILMILLAFLTFQHNISGNIAIFIALGLGLISAFDLPARQSLVVDLVAYEDLNNALALNSVIFNGARLIGPALGGLLVEQIGEGWCFALIALSYIPLIIFLSTMRIPPRTIAMRKDSFWHEMHEGVRFLRQDNDALRILLLVGLCSLTSVPYFSFLPMLADKVLHDGAGGAGMLMSITGIGALIAAFRLAWKSNIAAMSPWPLWASLMLAAAQIALGFSRHFWLSGLIAAVIGYAILTQNLASNSLLQHRVPDALRGRLMSFYSMMLIGTVPVGAIICGVVADAIGLPLTLIIGGVLCLIGSIVLAGWATLSRQPVTSAPSSVKEVDVDSLATVSAHQQVTIPLPDGTVLAGRLWLPAATNETVPLVLEWIPYRQSDNTAVDDSMVHGYFAAHGIAALRVDLRGSGNSTGLLRDEYLRQEQDDALDVIDWVTRQPWSNGNVGMIGISWGGFAALQVAARRPPALKAIITCCSTDDRYRDDVHYMGGALLTDGLQWGSGLFTQLGRPLDPYYVGESWRTHWLARMEGMEPPLHAWLAHPRRDDYWRHGSINEDYSAIQCAVYAVGGWTDGYSDAILRMMAHLSAPRKALIGPWTHIYPQWGTPGPAIDFLAECVRWWKHWLVEEKTPVMQEPMMTLWQGENIRPDAARLAIDGHWITAPHWPLAQTEKHFWLTPGRLVDEAVAAQPDVVIDSPTHCGLLAGEWCPRDGGGSAPEFQHDQRQDDGLSCCFDTPVLQDELLLLGKAIVMMEVAFDGPSALLVLRLNEVEADGRSGRVTFGVHRITRPQGVAPGEAFSVSLDLKGVSYRFAAGKRLRLAISTTYWPMVWAEPTQGAVRIALSSACLSLPLRPEAAADCAEPFAPAGEVDAIAHEVLSDEISTRKVVWDAGSDRWLLTMDALRRKTRIGELTFDNESHDVYGIGASRDTATMNSTRIQRYARPGWQIELRSEMHVSWVEGELQLISRYEAWENQQQVFQRQWQRTFPTADML